MAPYPESESMTVKRISVALKKRDWELLREGISKTQEKYNQGCAWENLAEWQELLTLGKIENMPQDLWNYFSGLINNILESCKTEVFEENSTEVPLYCEEQKEFEVQKQSFPKLAIFYNKQTEPAYASAIKKHKITLNNLIYDHVKYAPEPGWFEELSKLINNLDKPISEISALLSLINLSKKAGSIITTGTGLRFSKKSC